MNTQPTRAAARAAGIKLLRRMKGRGWRLRVHENIGWHYCVFRGPLQVVPSGPRHYFCLLSDDPAARHPMGGSGMWLDQERYSNPNKAVDEQIRLAWEVIGRLTRAVTRAAMMNVRVADIALKPPKRNRRRYTGPRCVAGCGSPVAYQGDPCGECACEDDCAPD